MSSLTTQVKISNSLESGLFSQISNWRKLLKVGHLYEFENQLSDCLKELQNQISEYILQEVGQELIPELMDQAREAGGCKIEVRPMCIRLVSGHRVQMPSPYVKQPKSGWIGSRHMLARHWGILGGSTPALYDKVGYCAALGPSYELAHQTLSKFGIQMCISSVRHLTNKMAGFCHDHGEANLMLYDGENLAGKRVVISTDGGRTRTRNYTGERTESGYEKYETPWCEPKLFVIDVLDESGYPDRKELPIYGCRFGHADFFDLLENYLKQLKIDQAKEVQIIADGAPWIWNHIQPMLLNLHVKADRITQTLDYYHASGYVHQLVEQMPKRINKRQRKCYLAQFKEWLWQGKSDLIVQQCRRIYERCSQQVKRWIDYLDKHQSKMQYADFEENKLMCGSGIIESAIRRIINLRFKNAATFWDKDNVEKLFCLRAALLAGRWNNLIRNIANVN
ncbi:MAG: hypothetical protein AAF705_03705 [Bacteroidota bacterium]